MYIKKKCASSHGLCGLGALNIYPLLLLLLLLASLFLLADLLQRHAVVPVGGEVVDLAVRDDGP